MMVVDDESAFVKSLNLMKFFKYCFVDDRLQGNHLVVFDKWHEIHVVVAPDDEDPFAAISLLVRVFKAEVDTDGEDRSGIRSPDDSEALVQSECLIRCHDGNVFHQCLRDDLAVEGIRMMSR
jgi:hypothetical protein